ncbi:hypothetical protein OU5_3018 [Pseudomonas mandelii JR-1]|uniref:Uncharacterized protein n=1 Tax=Pseudomonas mandelii JR-1 TaxID=1147786 RepID=A0A024EBB4_9PSED|nr:hypothetical protein OU5_3018 [Pseudomonas mandelii JR-1]
MNLIHRAASSGSLRDPTGASSLATGIKLNPGDVVAAAKAF